MFWRSKKSRKRSKPQRPNALAYWKLEHLESRDMLSVVNVAITGGPLGNSVALNGDSQGDSVQLAADPATPGQYIITGSAGGNPTLLTLNGGATTNQPLTINNVTGDITVSLGSGNATFDFEGPGGTALSTAPANLIINNSTGSDSVILNNVLVDGNLTVTKTAGASGNTSLSLTNTTIIGNSTVDNTGGGGAGGGVSTTTINSSTLEGSFALLNANGFATLTVTGTTSPTTFGAGNKGVNNVTITNGDGGSTTTFAANTTAYGALNITNGNTLPGELELVTFTGTTVQGGTTIVNGNSTTKVVSTNSNLGMQLAGPAAPAPVAIANGVGFNTLAVTGSTMPWGLSVSNDNAAAGPAATGNWGSSTTITSSSIGTRIGGPSIAGAPAGDALQIIGDKGPDVVNLTSNTIGGTLDLSRLGSGNNSVTLDSNTIGSVDIVTAGTGNNFVKIAGGVIQAALTIDFGNVGSNELDLRNGTTQINGSTAPVLPSLVSGVITITGGPGVNTFRYDAGVAIPPVSGFSIFTSP